jgi:hypothetical protein
MSPLREPIVNVVSQHLSVLSATLPFFLLSNRQGTYIDREGGNGVWTRCYEGICKYLRPVITREMREGLTAKL